MAEKKRIVKQSNLKDFSIKEYGSDSLFFSDKSQNLPGGGRFFINVQNEKVAARVLAAYKNDINFFQVAKAFAIKRTKGHAQRTTGFSPKLFPSDISRREAETIKRLQRALRDASVNAANQVGHNFDYDRDKAPSIAKPVTKHSFQLVIWFNAQGRQRFYPS